MHLFQLDFFYNLFFIMFNQGKPFEILLKHEVKMTLHTVFFTVSSTNSLLY